MALTDNIVHRWEFDEAVDPRADSVGSDDMTIAFGTNDGAVDGKIGQAVDLRDQAAALQVASNVDISGVNELSIAMWVMFSPQTTMVSGNKRIWRLADGANDQLQISIGVVRRVFVKHIVEGPSTLSIVQPVGTEIVDNTFYLITYTFTRNDFGRLYLNDEEVANIATPDQPSRIITTPTWTVGANHNTGIEQSFILADQLIIWDRAITPAEVTELWNIDAGLQVDIPAIADLSTTQTARTSVYENGLQGVTIKKLGVDSFEVWDRRLSSQAGSNPQFRNQIGPITGTWRDVKSYLDPDDTLLPASP